jgi:hypothetical protein
MNYSVLFTIGQCKFRAHGPLFEAGMYVTARTNVLNNRHRTASHCCYFRMSCVKLSVEWTYHYPAIDRPADRLLRLLPSVMSFA